MEMSRHTEILWERLSSVIEQYAKENNLQIHADADFDNCSIKIRVARDMKKLKNKIREHAKKLCAMNGVKDCVCSCGYPENHAECSKGWEQPILYAAPPKTETEDSCSTCKHEKETTANEPCVSCDDASNWEQKDKCCTHCRHHVQNKQPVDALHPCHFCNKKNYWAPKPTPREGDTCK